MCCREEHFRVGYWEENRFYQLYFSVNDLTWWVWFSVCKSSATWTGPLLEGSVKAEIRAGERWLRTLRGRVDSSLEQSPLTWRARLIM